jgi:hypothetical protein
VSHRRVARRVGATNQRASDMRMAVTERTAGAECLHHMGALQ